LEVINRIPSLKEVFRIISQYEDTDKLRSEDCKHETCHYTLRIYTLGHFKVVANSEVVSDKARRSSKLWELFKYLLTNRGNPVPVENIIDSLWPDSDYCDQNAALHTLAHRMRGLLKEEFKDGREPLSLDVSQGCYCMKVHDNCWIDTSEFASYTSKAVEQSRKDPDSAIDLYRHAISLYKGEYLPEYASRKWVLPAKRHYRHMYLQNLLGKMKLYMDSGNHEATCVLCEKAFQVEQFMEVESLHIYYMDALLRSGSTQEALCHYDFLTSSLYQEFGTKPSAAMRDLYRRMKPGADQSNLSLRAILDRLGEREKIDEAFICDLDFFRFLYNLEIRCSERMNRELVLALLSLSHDDYSLNKKSINEAMSSLEKVMLARLRKGDVVTRCGESQLLAFLADLDQAFAGKVLQRINDDFIRVNKSPVFKLSITVKQGFQQSLDEIPCHER
jgi:two-component SAPR family response regulator